MATFLVVEIPRMRTPGAAFLRTHPGLTMDFFLREPEPGDGPGTPFHVLCMAKGTPPADLEELRLLMQSAYPTFHMDEAPSPLGSWIAVYDVPSGPVDEVFKAVSRFTAENHLMLRWGRVEEGVVFLRALVDDPAQAHQLADRLRGYLGALGHDADVSVETEPEEALAIWLQVLRRASQQRVRPPEG